MPALENILFTLKLLLYNKKMKNISILILIYDQLGLEGR